MKASAFALLIIFSMSFTGCEKSFDQQMQEYMEFYYPTTGQYTYNVTFPWGEYVISTGATADEELHPDSEPYRGYITIRPIIRDSSIVKSMPVFLITPKGEVWINNNPGDIPASSHREEVTIEKSDSSTSTNTVTIESVSEPVIDNFQENKQTWKRYGKLEAAVGGGSVFTAVKN